MSQNALKTCTVCNCDVSNTKRIKDPRGRYYCNKCWALDKSAKEQDTGSTVVCPTCSGDCELSPDRHRAKCSCCRRVFSVKQSDQPGQSGRCANCGENVAESAAFCSHCGNAQPNGVSFQPVTSVPSIPIGDENRKANGGISKSRIPPPNPVRPSSPRGFWISISIAVISCFLLLEAVLQIVYKGTDLLPTGFCAVSGVVGLFVGVGCCLNACPKCFLLFTSEIIDSESLGSHIEVRREQRVARHYDVRGGGLQGQTRYDVDVPVSVVSTRQTKRCSKCGHIWQSIQRRET